MQDRSDLPTPGENEPTLFDTPKTEPSPSPQWKAVWNFLAARHLTLGIFFTLAVIGWILLRSSAHAQNKTSAHLEPKKPVDAPPIVVAAAEPVAATVSAPVAAVSESPAPAAAKPAAPKISWSSVNVDSPYIAITFDDGPHGANTPKLLAMLAQRHIKATFFLVGECVKDHPEIVKRTVAEGHEIASHSWSHPNLAAMSDEAVRSQLQRTQDAIVAACGVKPTLLRPPYGNLNTRQRAWVHSEFGYKIILWDVDPLDWKYRNSARVSHEILTHTQKGSIILVHDIHATSVDAMPETLDALIAKGFKFVTVSELLAMEKPKAPGTDTAATHASADSAAKAAPKHAPKSTPRKRAN